MKIVTKGTVYRTYYPEIDDVETATDLILDGLVPVAGTVFEEDEVTVQTELNYPS